MSNPVAQRPYSYQLANQKVGGNLDQLLADCRKRDLSFDQIADVLHEFNVYTSRETIRRWLQATPESAA